MTGLGDLFSSIFGKIGSIFGHGGGQSGGAPLWEKILTGGMAGAGTVGNMLEMQKRLAYQNMLMDFIRHPDKLAAAALKVEKPLGNDLVQAVNNRVQGDLATRGLATSPGIFGATEAQALAPFQQQNQQTAMNAVLSALGMPQGTFGNPMNTSGAWQMFLDTMKKPTVPAQSSASNTGFTFPTGIIDELGGYGGQSASTGDLTGFPSV